MTLQQGNELVAPSVIPADYIERVYAGWLGKVIGVRHGGNIEGWSYERIMEVYGEITGYIHHFKNFAADDDLNGPMFFLRALEDYTYTRELTAEQIGKTWLNYVGDSHGFFWWGGYGKSTEHTAYMNLKNGIPAPLSGSVEQNGLAVAEQIGGQIFIDVWGLIAPGSPTLAAEYAMKAASVSHGGNGIYGGQFIAACIAAAFVEKDIHAVIKRGLSVIPQDSEYVRMARAVMDFHSAHPENWRDCFLYVKANFGYDRYPGACHIIPNSAVIVLAMLYGDGEFGKTINICNMCGWDTDCNVGNVGAILGVLVGLDGIDDTWRKPVNDFLCCSSIIGTLNMTTIPRCAAYIANFGYKIAGVEPPSAWKEILAGRGPKFQFELPGSTHAFQTDAEPIKDGWVEVSGTLINSSEQAASGTRSLKAAFDRAIGGKRHRVFHKTYYRPDDFNDSRYDPSLSPQLYPGQTVVANLFIPSFTGSNVHARLYVMDGKSNVRHYGEKVQLQHNQWSRLQFTIPFLADACLEEAGVELVPKDNCTLTAYIGDFDFQGAPDYTISFANEQMEKWGVLHSAPSQCTYLRGIWDIEDGELSGSYCGEPAECYTGDYHWSDYRFEAEIVPKLGQNHGILFRVQGGIRSYAAVLSDNGKFVLYKNDNGYDELASTPFEWKPEHVYRVAVEAVGNSLKLFVGGSLLLSYKDEHAPYLTGQIGFINWGASHTHYKGFSVKKA